LYSTLATPQAVRMYLGTPASLSRGTLAYPHIARRDRPASLRLCPREPHPCPSPHAGRGTTLSRKPVQSRCLALLHLYKTFSNSAVIAEIVQPRLAGVLGNPSPAPPPRGVELQLLANPLQSQRLEPLPACGEGQGWGAVRPHSANSSILHSPWLAHRFPTGAVFVAALVSGHSGRCPEGDLLIPRSCAPRSKRRTARQCPGSPPPGGGELLTSRKPRSSRWFRSPSPWGRAASRRRAGRGAVRPHSAKLPFR
jgi:hypothetical protein